MKTRFEIEFDEEYDHEAFINFLVWNYDKANWKEDDCIHIRSWTEESI